MRLLKQWLQMPVEESDGRGGKRRSNPARRHKRGTPQGAPISPLLSNLYMRRFVLGWKSLGYGERLQARIVNCADDFVMRPFNASTSEATRPDRAIFSFARPLGSTGVSASRYFSASFFARRPDQGVAADCLQRPLVPRARFRPRLTSGVRRRSRPVRKTL